MVFIKTGLLKVILMLGFLLTLLCFVAVFWIYGFDVLTKSDYVSYVTGARVVAAGQGRKLYDLTAQFGVQTDLFKPLSRDYLLPFKSPPFLAFLFIPFSFFSLVWGYLSFLVSNALLFVALLAFFRKHLVSKNYLYLALLSLTFWPNYETLYRGQTSFILAMAFLAIYLAVKRGDGLGAGIFSSTLLFKPQYFLGVPFFFILTKDKRKFAKGFLITSLVLLLVSVLVVGPQVIFEYPRFLVFTETPFFGSFPKDMFTLRSTLNSLSTTAHLGSLGNLIFSGLVVVLLATYFYTKRKLPRPVLFSAALIATLALASHSLVHDLVVLQIPIFVFLGNKEVVASKLKSGYKLVALILYVSPLLLAVGLNWLAAPLFIACFCYLLKS